MIQNPGCGFANFLLDFAVICRAKSLIFLMGLRASTNSKPATPPIISNRRSHIYHRPGCPNCSQVAPHNRVAFNGTAEMEVAGIAAENGAFGADQQLSLRRLHSLTLRPSRIVYPGQIPHQLPRRLSIELEKLNTQLMPSYDPPNGDGRYFQ